MGIGPALRPAGLLGGRFAHGPCNRGA
jgi:hypothetical protein